VENVQDIRPAPIFGSISVEGFDDLLVMRFHLGKFLFWADFG
jgi:hypothetical protein